jgi:hypothetical protein
VGTETTKVGKLITLDDAAERLDISKHLAHRSISAGKVKAYRINAGVIRVFCVDRHKRWHVGEFAIDRADPSDGLLYFPDVPPLWVFAEEFGKLNRKKRTRSGRVKIGEGGRYTSDNDWARF